MGNSSKDTTKNGASRSPVQSNASPQPSDTPSTKQDEIKAEPLAPPPRPDTVTGQTPDYFSIAHSHLASESNPFEYSFIAGQKSNSTDGAANGTANGTLNPSVNGAGDQTPGGTKLPSVAALASPSGFLGTTPNFWSGLRSGPLSPAMLSGPAKDDYFSDGHHLRGGFTPNESGLRSGLTPGGGGSMFPEPSPNAQALYNSFASGGATPTTLEFHRTAAHAAAHNRNNMLQQNITSQPPNTTINNVLDIKPILDDHANDAANGLYLLANQNQSRNNHYTMAPSMPVHSHPQPVVHMGGNSQQASPNMDNQQHGSISTASGRGVSEMSDEHEQQRPNTRGKGKRNSDQMANSRQKTNGNSKASASKKAKGNSGRSMVMEPEPQSEEEPDMSKDEYNANGKKMTDDEKRRNFLERNRVAALKCRQRKKQWLANLQQKVEIFSTENDALSQQIGALRDEVVNLKTLLLAHKDCPITAQQGLQGMVHQLQVDGYGAPGAQMAHDPYGMARMNGQQGMNGQQIMNGQPNQQRRFS